MAVRALGAPLQSWRLDYHLPARLIHADSRLIWLTLGAGLAASAAFLLLLGLDFYRESSREMREASQRVNFVNQVSHELKTPLTNIRLYAELMGERFDTEEDPKTRQYLDVIAHESQRLSPHDRQRADLRPAGIGRAQAAPPNTARPMRSSAGPSITSGPRSSRSPSR